MTPTMPLLAVALLTALPLTTVAEQSGWVRTGRFDEVETLCAAFPTRYSGKVKCERFGTTPLGRPMLALVASADGVLTAEATKAKKRPVVVLQGGIHAGEIDGKDAGFWLLRQLLEGQAAAGALAKVTVVFVPVFNIDGHERFGKNQRPNQRGPEETGWRVTAQNLNLNRDYMKAEAPEMLAMLGLLHRFDPIMYVDLHVTDGAKFEHDVSVTFEPQRLGPEAMAASGKALRAALFPKLEARGHLPVGFYPSFVDADDPTSGFSSGWPPPRFGTAYWALHHRFGVLVETHSWKPYAERVKATFDVCEGLLQEAALHGAQWLSEAQRADTAAAALAGVDLPLAYETVKEPAASVDFRGYAYTRTPSEVSGKFWVKYDEKAPQLWKVPLWEQLAPSLTVRAPRAGYVIPAAYAAVVGPKLKAHGLSFITVREPKPQRAVERLVAEPKFRQGPYEGRLTVEVKGGWASATEDLTTGSLYVPIAQPHAEVVMALLEPTAPDSLTTWGYFNAQFEQKEYLEDYLTEAFAREQLTDPKVKAAFDERLRTPDFKKSPEARLGFFARLHPSFDTRMNVVPVYRVDRAP
jgi:Zinc carboxypeptidase